MEVLDEFLDVNRDAAAHVVDLIDADQLVGFFEELVVQRDHYELTIFCSFLDEFSYVGSILEVQGCVDFVHEVNCIWLVLMQGVDKR